MASIVGNGIVGPVGLFCLRNCNSSCTIHPTSPLLFAYTLGTKSILTYLVNLSTYFSGLASAFEKRKWNTEVVDFGVPYDFASIMHYPFTAFSKNGKPTIRNIVDMQGKTPYIELSDGDARQTNAMYKCNGK